MEIHVFDRSEVQRGIAIRGNYVVISIRDPDKPRAKVKRQPGLQDVLFVAFHNTEPTPGLTLPPEIHPLTPAEADQIAAFVWRHRFEVEAMVVHCEQGLSRSPAVAAAISDALGLDPRPFWQMYSPNKYVYHTVADAFERNPPPAVETAEGQG